MREQQIAPFQVVALARVVARIELLDQRVLQEESHELTRRLTPREPADGKRQVAHAAARTSLLRRQVRQHACPEIDRLPNVKRLAVLPEPGVDPRALRHLTPDGFSKTAPMAIGRHG